MLANAHGGDNSHYLEIEDLCQEATIIQYGLGITEIEVYSRPITWMAVALKEA